MSWLVKFDGPCSKCGITLRAGEPAVWDRATGSMHCVACPVQVEAEVVSTPIDRGTAGRSTWREHDRRAAKREAGIEARWGTGWVSRLVKAISTEPQSTRAWAIGARGEEKLAEVLAGVEGLQVLHDRRVPRTSGNIDHIVIAPSGVFVVDAKAYEGLIEIRNYGPFWRPDPRLTVGRRDESKLAFDMGWQVDAVTAALQAAGVDPMPSVSPVLCFVDGRWPVFRPPNEFAGVRLESELSIRNLFATDEALDPGTRDRVARVLAMAFPPKQ